MNLSIWLRRHFFINFKSILEHRSYRMNLFQEYFHNYSKTSFIGTLIFRDLANSFIGTFCSASNHHSLYIVTWSGVTTIVMGTHHEAVGGSGGPLQIPINEVFTFQGRPDKWGFTVLPNNFIIFTRVKDSWFDIERIQQNRQIKNFYRIPRRRTRYDY